jgi:hypothetical protein
MGGDPGRGRRRILSADAGPWVRRAGTGRLPGGRRLTWTLADGTRGRRWRATTTSADGRLVQALLLEVDPAGHLLKLEVAAPAGLLTLHPAADGRTLHGNVVRAAGVEHVSLPWSAGHALLAGASPITGGVTALGLEGTVGAGEGASFPAVEVAEDLSIRRATWRAARVGERRWRLLAADGGPSVVVELGPDGVPAGLDDAEGWPLEVATALA